MRQGEGGGVTRGTAAPALPAPTSQHTEAPPPPCRNQVEKDVEYVGFYISSFTTTMK